MSANQSSLWDTSRRHNEKQGDHDKDYPTRKGQRGEIEYPHNERRQDSGERQDRPGGDREHSIDRHGGFPEREASEEKIK